MEHQINKNNTMKSKIDFDTAQSLLLDRFIKLHPKDTWPEWLSRSPAFSFTLDKMRQLEMSLTVVPKEPLGPNEFWEEIDGHKMLVRINPVTGKKGIILCKAPRKVITLFKAVVHPETAEVTVLIDTDLSNLAGEEFEGY